VIARLPLPSSWAFAMFAGEVVVDRVAAPQPLPASAVHAAGGGLPLAPLKVEDHSMFG
jgi:hypothetical protein